MVRVILLGLAALLIAAGVPATEPSPPAKWQAGKHYQVLKSPQATHVALGKVEVIEVFRYTCPHCDDLEPHVLQWLQTRPAFIEFIRLPVAWRANERPYAQLYYALQALNRADLHQAVFDAVFRGDKLLEFHGDTDKIFASFSAFAVAHGIDAVRFEQAYRSRSVTANVAQAEKTARAYGITGVPTLLLDGKYLLQLGPVSAPELFALINELAEGEKHNMYRAKVVTAQIPPL